MVLKTEEEFWKNRIRMARDTSVDMIIDLVDSVLVLEMKGVPMKESKIDEYRLSNLLFRIINSDSLPWFVNRIFVLKDDWATIPKEPIVIKEAPKSPREVDIDTPIEIPVDTGKVQIIFHFNENLSIQIDPEQKINDDRWIIKNKYDTWIPSPASKKEKRMLRESISPLQKYWIKLQVDNNDARVIYRALLQGAEIVVRLK